mmetsp:Transcript_50980/g.51386  ORF Transcript_50980/g.51386 Transcript_50980/m.51386 type:complete len:110 (-) Transcript_50980:808-1137(-)
MQSVRKQTCTDLPVPTMKCGHCEFVAVDEHRIIALKKSGSVSGRIEVYDIENGSRTVDDREWHSLARAPAPQRQRCGLVVVDGTLHVIGGRCRFLEFVFTGAYRVNSNE